MKRFFLFLTIILFISGSLWAQSDSDWESKTYDVGNFSIIHLEGGYKVYLAQGNECSVKVKANDNDVFDYLKIKKVGRKLDVSIEDKYFNFDRINLYITVRNIEEMNVEGGLNLKTKGYLDVEDLRLHVQGGAKIELDLKADDIELVGEGGILVEMSGVSKKLDVRLSGAGHIDAEELKTEDVSFRLEGVGTGTVYATETLDAKIEGVGKIKYRGNPRVTKNIEGLGSVKRN